MKKINIARDAFNTKQTEAIIGATVRQLGHWDKQGVVKPSIRPASGRGSRRLYSYADLLALKAVKNFRDHAVPLEKIRKCVSYLRNHLPDISNPLGICTLIDATGTLYLATDKKTLIDTVTSPGQQAYRQLIDIADLDRQLRATVLRLIQKRVELVEVGDMSYQVEIDLDAESGGYVATVAGLPGCITDGDTLDEVLEMAGDAISCWEEARRELSEQGVHVPKTKTKRSKKRA